MFLVKHLLEVCDSSNLRIVPVSSEAAFWTLGMDYQSADFASHLLGAVPAKEKMSAIDYGWTKGILALYRAAYTRRHPESVVAIVSPGSVPNTNLLRKVSLSLKVFAKLGQCLGGSHTVLDGAERYVWALLGTGPFDDSVSSGTFWASRKGFAKDFGNVETLKKARFIADQDHQEKACAVVQSFVVEGEGM